MSRRHSLIYLLYPRSPLWRLRRRLWIIRAGGRCERCGSRRALSIHHTTYRRLGHERRADIEVLCWPCHRAHHEHGPCSPARRWRRTAAALLVLAALVLALMLAELAAGVPHR